MRRHSLSTADSPRRENRRCLRVRFDVAEDGLGGDFAFGVEGPPLVGLEPGQHLLAEHGGVGATVLAVGEQHVGPCARDAELARRIGRFDLAGLDPGEHRIAPGNARVVMSGALRDRHRRDQQFGRCLHGQILGTPVTGVGGEHRRGGGASSSEVRLRRGDHRDKHRRVIGGVGHLGGDHDLVDAHRSLGVVALHEAVSGPQHAAVGVGGVGQALFALGPGGRGLSTREFATQLGLAPGPLGLMGLEVRRSLGVELA